MQFVVFCEDKPDSQDLRLATREDHLAFLDVHRGKVRLAGPMLSDDGESMVGSVFIIEADSLQEVRSMSAEDPYTKAGLFQQVIIRPFRQVIPAS